MSAVSIQGVSKTYGRVQALRDVNLEIPRGSVFGLLGPNGSGKTTLFHCALRLAHASSGSVRFDGAVLSPTLLQRVGFVPEQSALYDWMTIAQHFDMQRRWFRRYDAALAARLQETFGLDARKRVRALSKGLRTATAIALAFCTRPDFVILDEPTSGLDAFNQRSALGYIVEAAASGCTVVLSSHHIGDIERAADRVAIISSGSIVLTGAVDDLKAEHRIVEAAFADEAPLGVFEGDARVVKAERAGRVLRLFVRGDADGVMHDAKVAGAVDARAIDVGLEDIFLNVADPGRRHDLAESA